MLYTVTALEFAFRMVDEEEWLNRPMNLFMIISRGSDILGRVFELRTGGSKFEPPEPAANTALRLRYHIMIL